jgi:hypothetical protein
MELEYGKYGLIRVIKPRSDGSHNGNGTVFVGNIVWQNEGGASFLHLSPNFWFYIWHEIGSKMRSPLALPKLIIPLKQQLEWRDAVRQLRKCRRSRLGKDNA